MVYFGYDFSFPIMKDDFDSLHSSIKESLSNQRLNKARMFLESVRDYIADIYKFFREDSRLKKETVAISIMENFTGQDGFPNEETSQAWHSDYCALGKLKEIFNS